MANRTPLERVVVGQGRRIPWIADQLGIDKSEVYRWTRGARPIPPARVPQLAEMLGVKAEEITDLEEVS